MGIIADQEVLEVITTDATPTNIFNFPIQPDSSVILECFIRGKLEHNATGAGWRISLAYSRADNGIPVQDAANKAELWKGAGTGAWDAQIVSDGIDTLLLQVTGEAGKTIHWVGWFSSAYTTLSS